MADLRGEGHPLENDRPINFVLYNILLLLYIIYIIYILIFYIFYIFNIFIFITY